MLKKRSLKLMTCVLSIAILMASLPISAFAVDDSIDSVFAGGDGSIQNPYKVSTPEQLNAVRNDLSACYIQINDIDLSTWGNWEPIGTYEEPFVGTFNGSNNTISNLTIENVISNKETTCLFGLFGYTDNSKIQNVTLQEIDYQISYISSFADCYIGGLVAVSYSDYSNSIGVENCRVSGSITVSGSSLKSVSFYIGGVAGYSYSSVNGCISYVTISVETANNQNRTNGIRVDCGGIIGVGNGIYACGNFGDVTVLADDFVSIGGIAASLDDCKDCFNAGDLKGIITDYKYYSGSYISCCVGGIAAFVYGSDEYIENCVNYGDIFAQSQTYGRNCHSYSGGVIGGGVATWNDGSHNMIKHCYNVSKNISSSEINADGETIKGTSNEILARYNSSFIVDCYTVNNTIINGNCTSGLINTMSPEELLSENKYSGFDFDNYWEIDKAIGGAVLKIISNNIESENPNIPDASFEQLYFEEPIVILDIGESKTLNVHSRNVANINGELVYSNDKVVDFSELQWSSLNFGDTPIVTVNDKGQIVGNSEGLKWLSVRSKDDINLSASCQVYVGNPNSLEFSSKYDSKQYYAEGGFYSELSSISDCVEVYLLFENKLAEELEEISGIDVAIKNDTEKQRFKDIAPIKLTATINGNGLSFDRNSYQNTYTTTLNGISVGEAVDDILMLFPNDLSVAPSGNNYNIKVTLESDSFETITEEYSFTVENLETKSANEHIDFVSSNKDYKVSKQNIYGETMVSLKSDAEYIFSKYSTLDFENYYEVVFADILIELMNTSQLGHVSLLPVVKEWVGNYKTILSEVSTIVEDDYTGYLNVTENAFDKVLKKSKYTTEGMNVHDEIRDLVVMKLKDKVSIDKINSAFAAVDKTQQYFTFFELSVDITNDIADFIDGVSVLNAYKGMDDEFKAVINNIYNQIPDSESKLKKAVYHYVNVDSYLGYSSEILNEVRDMAGAITLDVFNTVYKKQVVSSIGKAIGNISLKSGALLSSTTAFSAISTGLSAVTTGAQLGLCISDIICDNGGKSEEMSKVVAMSEFSPYVISTLNHYESKLYNDRNDDAVTCFEYAFAMHKATQSYIMQHTIKSLETKRDSIVIRLFSRDDYDGMISEVLVHKGAIDNLKCHNSFGVPTLKYETKVIAIKCPVDVYIYDASGIEVVRIIGDVNEFVATGINVFVDGGEKYVAVPANQDYSVKIVAWDSGAMDYSVTEFMDGCQKLRTVEKSDISLENQREFTGTIVTAMGVEAESYALSYNNEKISPDKIIVFDQNGNVIETEPSSGNDTKPSNTTEPSTGDDTKPSEPVVDKGIMGDVNGDGKVNIKDATMIQKAAAKIIELTDDEKLRADVNADNKNNVKDATAIQKFVAKIETGFPIGEQIA